MTPEILLGLVAVGGGAWWLMASGSREPPPMPSLGDYEQTLTLPPSRSVQRKREHDGKGRA